jgi:hypothetical protein
VNRSSWWVGRWMRNGIPEADGHDLASMLAFCTVPGNLPSLYEDTILPWAAAKALEELRAGRFSGYRWFKRGAAALPSLRTPRRPTSFVSTTIRPLGLPIGNRAVRPLGLQIVNRMIRPLGRAVVEVMREMGPEELEVHVLAGAPPCDWKHEQLLEWMRQRREASG